jgi:hypothetical protein
LLRAHSVHIDTIQGLSMLVGSYEQCLLSALSLVRSILLML